MSERDGDRMAVICLTVGYMGICNSEVLEDQTMYRLYEGNIVTVRKCAGDRFMGHIQI